MKRLALLAALALVLTGCTPSADNSPAAVELAFLQALENRDAAAALALTTLDAGEFSCTALLSDYERVGGGILNPTVGEVSIDGDTASVGFSYLVALSGGVESKGTHTLVRDGDSWLIEFPEEYRISATIPTDVVGTISIAPRASDPDQDVECAATPTDGAYELIALPGSYRLNVTDPTGVFERSRLGDEILVFDGPGSGTATELTYIDPSEFDQAKIDARNFLIDYVAECAESGFIDAYCPEGLPSDASITLDPNSGKRFTDYPTDITIFSENGTDWRFTAGGEEFLYIRNGVAESFPMSYSGAVITDPLGEFGLVLD